jgi:hypothetical protein
VKKNIFSSLGMVFILIILLFLTVSFQTIKVKDYIQGKLPSIFGFYLSSLEDFHSYKKEFIYLKIKGNIIFSILFLVLAIFLSGYSEIVTPANDEAAIKNVIHDRSLTLNDLN